jgi:hypothetical protein
MRAKREWLKGLLLAFAILGPGAFIRSLWIHNGFYFTFREMIPAIIGFTGLFICLILIIVLNKTGSHR